MGFTDDFVIRPGQTWCVITSAVEGDTHITAYAPGIANWDKGKVFVTCRWVDANWEFPPPAVARAGSEHVFTTKIFRHTVRQPLAKYRVRYKILDCPADVLKSSGTTEYTSVSDLEGNAQVAIARERLHEDVETLAIVPHHRNRGVTGGSFFRGLHPRRFGRPFRRRRVSG